MRFPYGRGFIELDVDGDLLTRRDVPVVRDEEGAVREALRHPIGTPPLSQIVQPGERVAILVNDITRLTRTDLFLPPLVETLNAAGIADQDMFIVFALGIHRPQTDEERRAIIGDELFRRIRNFDHDAGDEANLAAIGVTSFGNTVQINRAVWEADRIILTGEIMHHLIAGYSGGRKSLAPGVAGARTTTFNHAMIFDPRCRAGLLDGNPAHEDLLEACRMAEPDFLVNVVLSPEGGLLQVVAGHYDTAHRAGCRTVDEALCAPIDELYDVVVASAGGYPLDVDLRQAHKPLENACRALKPGGTVLFFAECPDGAGHSRFADYVRTYADDFAMEKALREKFEVGGHKAYWVARLGRLYDVRLVSGLDEEFVRRCHFKPADAAEFQVPTGARVALLPHAGHTLPVLAGGPLE